GKNVQELLDQILLQAELLDLKANPDRRAQGTVLEATLDPGKGPLATILVQNGTLRGGDDFICGQFYGRVRAMYDERGQTVHGAGPSTPVQVLGFEGGPEAGDTFQGTTDAAAARACAPARGRCPPRTCCWPRPRTPSSSASTSGPTPTRAPRRSARRSRSAPTASSTRQWKR